MMKSCLNLPYLCEELCHRVNHSQDACIRGNEKLLVQAAINQSVWRCVTDPSTCGARWAHPGPGPPTDLAEQSWDHVTHIPANSLLSEVGRYGETETAVPSEVLKPRLWSPKSLAEHWGRLQYVPLARDKNCSLKLKSNILLKWFLAFVLETIDRVSQ